MRKILRRLLFQTLKTLGSSPIVWVFPIKEVKTKRERKLFTRIWHTVWLEEKYSSIEERITNKYAKYDYCSTDIIVTFLGRWPIGTMRLVWSEKNDFPALNDFKIQKTWKDKVVEFTLLTVKKNWRGFGIPSLVLMREGYCRAKKEGAEGIIMITEQRLFHFLTKKLSFLFRKVSAEKEYEGGICFVSFVNIEEAEQTLAEKDPQLLKFFIK